MAASNQLMAKFDLKLCSTEEDLKRSYMLRMAVFHDEQGFPADTEVDEYDPISAHFIVQRRDEDATVATVRLTPYPRKPWLANAPSTSVSEPLPSPGMTQNESSMVTSGGGPKGTSGGLPMFSSDDAGQDSMGTKSKGAPADVADDREARERWPLGQPLSSEELQRRFKETFLSSGPIDEAEGAPKVRGAKVSRLAVSSDQRGLGLGNFIMRKVEDWLVGPEMSSGRSGDASPREINVVISSQMHAKPFYEKLGYSVYGEPYEEEGAPHCWCVKRMT